MGKQEEIIEQRSSKAWAIVIETKYCGKYL